MPRPKPCGFEICGEPEPRYRPPEAGAGGGLDQGGGRRQVAAGESPLFQWNHAGPVPAMTHPEAGHLAAPPERLLLAHRGRRGGGSAIERACVARGLKMTGQRRVIARVLSEAADHPDVEEVYRRAAKLDSHISIATVYRTVRLFEEKGILEKRDFGGGRARYEPSEHGHHYHLIDVDTGRVTEFSESGQEALLQVIAERLGFNLVSVRLELFGRRKDAEGGEAEQPGDRS